MTEKKYYKILDDFGGIEDKEDVISKFPEVCKIICKYNFSLSRKTIDRMFYSLVYGNWSCFLESEKEKGEDITVLIKKLKRQIFYCDGLCDWDRYIKILWIYQRILRRKEEGLI